MFDSIVTGRHSMMTKTGLTLQLWGLLLELMLEWWWEQLKQVLPA